MADTMFDPECHQCDIGGHVCPGCGDNVPHGKLVCDDCMAEVMEAEEGEMEREQWEEIDRNEEL